MGTDKIWWRIHLKPAICAQSWVVIILKLLIIWEMYSMQWCCLLPDKTVCTLCFIITIFTLKNFLRSWSHKWIRIVSGVVIVIHFTVFNRIIGVLCIRKLFLKWYPQSPKNTFQGIRTGQNINLFHIWYASFFTQFSHNLV